MGLAEVTIALIVIGLPICVIGFMFGRWFDLKQKRIELEASLAAEKAAQYAAGNAELEARIRVLEKIVTDGGMQTAAQIEALRDLPPSPVRAKSGKRALTESKT